MAPAKTETLPDYRKGRPSKQDGATLPTALDSCSIPTGPAGFAPFEGCVSSLNPLSVEVSAIPALAATPGTSVRRREAMVNPHVVWCGQRKRDASPLGRALYQFCSGNHAPTRSQPADVGSKSTIMCFARQSVRVQPGAPVMLQVLRGNSQRPPAP